MASLAQPIGKPIHNYGLPTARPAASWTLQPAIEWSRPATPAVRVVTHAVVDKVDNVRQGQSQSRTYRFVREFSEEFLGTPEHDGSAGDRIDYDLWPLYRTLSSARDAGQVRSYCFGLGIDPLALGIDILTAVVIDSELFDTVFGDLVQVNAEGQVISNSDAPETVGFPFTEESVHRFVQVEPMGPGGAACLSLAWRHRDALALT
jgi:hypothetical protein